MKYKERPMYDVVCIVRPECKNMLDVNACTKDVIVSSHNSLSRAIDRKNVLTLHAVSGNSHYMYIIETKYV
jgi:hypothetical protein